MGGIGKLLSFVRRSRNGANVSDTTVDPGGGPNLTAEHFAAPGDDSHPLRDDFVLLMPLRQTGRAAAAGYLDPKNEQLAAVGERRLYARNESGTVVATVWIKNTGEVLVENDNGSITLQPDGGTVTESPEATHTVAADGTVAGSNEAGSFTLAPDGSYTAANGAGSIQLQAGGNVVINGVIITPAGAISTPTSIASPSIQANGVEVAGHNHTQPNDSNGDAEQPTNPMQEP